MCYCCHAGVAEALRLIIDQSVVNTLPLPPPNLNLKHPERQPTELPGFSPIGDIVGSAELQRSRVTVAWCAVLDMRTNNTSTFAVEQQNMMS